MTRSGRRRAPWRSLVLCIVVTLVMNGIALPAAASGIQPNSYTCSGSDPGSGTTGGRYGSGSGCDWYTHFIDEVFVAYGLGDLACNGASGCNGTSYTNYRVGAFYWHDNTCYNDGDGCGDVTIGVCDSVGGCRYYDNPADGSHADVRSGAMGATFANAGYHASLFTYCKYVDTSTHACTNTTTTTTDSLLASGALVLTWNVKRDDSPAQGNGAAVLVTAAPGGYPTPCVNGALGCNTRRQTANPQSLCEQFRSGGATCAIAFAPPSTPCNRYVSDFVRSTLFGGYQSFQWKWISHFTGSWSFLRHDGNAVTIHLGDGTDPATFTDGEAWHIYDVVIGDATANGQAPWVLSVNDTGTGVACTFSVADADQGVLIPPLDAPTLTGVSACYNTTGHLCPAPLTGVNGEVLVSFTLGGGAWADVETGPAGPLTGCASSPTLYGPLELDAGTYTTSGLTVDPTTDAPSFAVHAFNNAGEACVYATLDYSTPGKVVELPDPVNPATHTCSITDVACELTNLFSVAENALVGPVRGAVNGVRDLMLAKQPFNYIVRAFNGVSGQLARASDAVTSTTDCPGVTFTVPMPSAYWPSGVALPEWTVLKCADFEPLVSTTTYQTIRGVMDAGIYLFWGWAELRALRPRFVAAA